MLGLDARSSPKKMPKRSYPFAESFSSQYKIHIGQKELNNHGVYGDKYRQEIYEKTKTLLFNGTKAVMGKIWNIDTEKCSTIQPSGPGVTPDVSRTLLRGQALIGQDGRLTPVQALTTPTTSSPEYSANQRPPLAGYLFPFNSCPIEINNQVLCWFQRAAVCVRRPRGPGGSAPSVTAQPAPPASSSAPTAPTPVALSALSSITVASMSKYCAAAAYRNQQQNMEKIKHYA
ncbi:apoptosis regulatory protein Siva-like isoform X1 [Salvelinus alpinus]|uniref:apoptosis regulatory protein Siva-like isoform X1 n=1 Tax=Salvelinus alpinus TaxID=8036 RepID=UPI0039FB9BCB